MVNAREYRRHSQQVTRTKRWKVLRQRALERDDWQCVECHTRMRLEVDHIKPVRTHPELAFSLDNLQTLCGQCHARKTAHELGHAQINPRRMAWRKLVNNCQKPQATKEKPYA